ncbi:MAG: PAS domain-containing protein [Caulobacteraceae bacterium]
MTGNIAGSCSAFPPLADPSGAIVKWCGVNTDIEDRKRAEEAVRLYERRAQMIVDGLPAIVTLMTPDGELENANRHMLDYFGETLDVLKSRPVGPQLPPG